MRTAVPGTYIRVDLLLLLWQVKGGLYNHTAACHSILSQAYRTRVYLLQVLSTRIIYHSGRKYKDRLILILMYKRS